MVYDVMFESPQPTRPLSFRPKEKNNPQGKFEERKKKGVTPTRG